MIIDANWSPPPMVKDLPRDGRIAIRCKACDLSWSEPVIDLMDRKLGAMFVDLLEMQTRCLHPACRRAVAFVCETAPPVKALVPMPTVRRPVPTKPIGARHVGQIDLFGRDLAQSQRPAMSHVPGM